jgi:hypothetical protein
MKIFVTKTSTNIKIEKRNTMKKIIIAISIFISTSVAHADPACTALGNFVGIKYKLVSKTCNNPVFFGDDFKVEPYEASNFSGYNLTSGSASIGPATSTESTDRCTASGETVAVETCAYDQSCIPRGWLYTISKSSVVFSMNGCEAKYSAQ